MPELPEVETTRCGIYPHLIKQTIAEIVIRNKGLRLPVADNLSALCRNKTIIDITRRGKYLLIHLNTGCLLIHLGMTGHLRLLAPGQATPGKHDHIDLILYNGQLLRYNDPRRFGLWLYSEAINQHPLISQLGPEPLSEDFSPEALLAKAKNKKQCVKAFIMDSHTVVGVGNIYAAESLFLAKIHPLLPAGNLSKAQCQELVEHIKLVLQRAIDAGGTTLRDFYSSDGKPGYFSQNLQVYGRQGQPCFRCQTLIEMKQIGQRSSAFCPNCQIYPP